MTIRTMATPAQIAAFRAGMVAESGKRGSGSERRFVKPFASQRGDDWLIQLAMFVEAKQANGAWWSTWDTISAQKYDIIDQLTLLPQLMADRHRIASIEYTRVSPGKLDDDNVPSAFKPILDATCVVIEEGERARLRLSRTKSGKKRVRGKDIGHFDGRVIGEGEGKASCRYDQTVHELDKRLFGIRIRLRLRPRSETSTMT